LLNRLVQGSETAAIVGDIKADVGLSYRLLHYMNMVGVGGTQQIGSIEHAVALLGRNGLYRWLSMLLVHFAAARPVSSALQEAALARARFMELLALDNAEPAAASLFMLGLASMLGLLLHASLPDAIAPLNLPEPAREALLAHTGPWYSYLALAIELQNPMSVALEEMAAPFGGMAPVARCLEEAWAWAGKAAVPPGSQSTTS
jgi:c-di-GMP phosphodiesterase